MKAHFPSKKYQLKISVMLIYFNKLVFENIICSRLVFGVASASR
ncbi:hypothetical protein BH11PSE12_BH11PSE12_33200 [soil metagenome]